MLKSIEMSDCIGTWVHLVIIWLGLLLHENKCGEQLCLRWIGDFPSNSLECLWTITIRDLKIIVHNHNTFCPSHLKWDLLSLDLKMGCAYLDKLVSVHISLEVNLILHVEVIPFNSSYTHLSESLVITITLLKLDLWNLILQNT